jgi:hypothetical protein
MTAATADSDMRFDRTELPKSAQVVVGGLVAEDAVDVDHFVGKVQPASQCISGDLAQERATGEHAGRRCVVDWCRASHGGLDEVFVI